MKILLCAKILLVIACSKIAPASNLPQAEKSRDVIFLPKRRTDGREWLAREIF
jgi:hypothetical protein